MNIPLNAEVAEMIRRGESTLAYSAVKLGWHRRYGSITWSSYRLRLLYIFIVALESWISDESDVNYIGEGELRTLLSKTEQLINCC